VLQLDESGNLLLAGDAPRRPEVEQNDLPFEVGQRHFLSVRVLERKIQLRRFPFFFFLRRQRGNCARHRHEHHHRILHDASIPFPWTHSEAWPVATLVTSSVRPFGHDTTTRSRRSRRPTPNVTGSSD